MEVDVAMCGPDGPHLGVEKVAVDYKCSVPDARLKKKIIGMVGEAVKESIPTET